MTDEEKRKLSELNAQLNRAFFGGAPVAKKRRKMPASKLVQLKKWADRTRDKIAESRGNPAPEDFELLRKLEAQIAEAEWN